MGCLKCFENEIWVLWRSNRNLLPLLSFSILISSSSDTKSGQRTFINIQMEFAKMRSFITEKSVHYSVTVSYTIWVNVYSDNFYSYNALLVFAKRRMEIIVVIHFFIRWIWKRKRCGVEFRIHRNCHIWISLLIRIIGILEELSLF